MKIIHILKIELWKSIINWGFVFSVLITFCLLFTTQVYTDITDGKTYNVLESYLQLRQDVVYSTPEFASILILQKTLSSYFVMFIPIIAAFPFIPNFCAERNSGLIRFAILRTGKLQYYITKFLSAIFSGGFSVLLGYFLFFLVISATFPSITDYDLPKELLSLYKGSNSMVTIVLAITGVFLYGCVSTIPAFLLAAFVRNRYIITCVPFMIMYLYSSSLTKLIYDSVIKQNQKLINFYTMLKPESISCLYRQDNISRNSMLIFLCFGVACFLLFVSIMNRRRDYGD
jgi:hypothetical protein